MKKIFIFSPFKKVFHFFWTRKLLITHYGMIFLIVISLATFSSAHIHEHTKINTHTDEFHSSSFNEHTHLGNEYNAFEIHESHHLSLHKHLDDLFLRSIRQRKGDGKLFIPQIFTIQKTFLNWSRIANLKKLKMNIHTIYYNTLFVSSNQPLLI